MQGGIGQRSTALRNASQDVVSEQVEKIVFSYRIMNLTLYVLTIKRTAG
jgi:hypothetical protein